MNADLAPNCQEIEISLFGPGYGESVLLHIGNGDWIIIDSCIDDNSEEPRPLMYLRNIGVDISKDVKYIVATHWHNDHIRGLSYIFKECTNADFICSPVMLHKNMLMLKFLYSSVGSLNDSGMNEIHKIYDLLEERGKHPKKAIAGRDIFFQEKDQLPYDVILRSFSPSDAAVEAYARIIYNEICNKPESQIRAPSIKPNFASVVLQLITGDQAVLLGADMENHKEFGWHAILGNSTCQRKKSSVYKVAHHGSKSGHHDNVWSVMLTDEPIAIVTPFNRGRFLPMESDRKRIRKLSKESFITKNALLSKKIKGHYNKEVEKTLRGADINVRKVLTSPGHIRIRYSPIDSCSMNVKLFDGAKVL